MQGERVLQVGRLKTVPLRTLWPNEAYAFTTWPAGNLESLAQVIDTDLTLVEREASAGPFSADILAKDGNGNSVVVEHRFRYPHTSLRAVRKLERALERLVRAERSG